MSYASLFCLPSNLVPRVSYNSLHLSYPVCSAPHIQLGTFSIVLICTNGIRCVAVCCYSQRVLQRSDGPHPTYSNLPFLLLTNSSSMLHQCVTRIMSNHRDSVALSSVALITLLCAYVPISSTLNELFQSVRREPYFLLVIHQELQILKNLFAACPTLQSLNSILGIEVN